MRWMARIAAVTSVAAALVALSRPCRNEGAPRLTARRRRRLRSSHATGTFELSLLPGLTVEIRERRKERLMTVLLGADGQPPAGFSVKQLGQCWTSGYAARYAEMSLPALEGRDYGTYSTRVRLADLSQPPPGVDAPG